MSTAVLGPGRYLAGLAGADGKLLARNEFWVPAEDARPEVGTASKTYKPAGRST